MIHLRILIAEDEPDIREAYRVGLEDREYEVVLTNDGQECLDFYLAEQEKQRSSGRNDTNHQQPSSEEKILQQSKTQESKTVTALAPSSSLTITTASAQPQQPPPFDIVILDYKMPRMDGLQTAKEILKINPNQRIIFASAYVLDTLVHSVKELNRVVELMQKPFEISALIDTIEDREASEGLKRLMVSIRDIKNLDNPTSNQVQELFEGLKKIQKFRNF